MSFFKSKDDTTDSWKLKYFSLLETQEQTENTLIANQDLLCKTIVRFAIAVKGLNTQLDPHLSRIRDVLKGGLKSNELKHELQAFSNALLALEDNHTQSQLDGALLFEFLHHQFPTLSQDLSSIETRYNQREYINLQQLYDDLIRILNSQQNNHADFSNELATIDSQNINHHLIQLLDSVQLPEDFADETQQLKTRLLNGQPLGEVLEQTIALLLAVKNHLETEQQEMAEFLAKLTEQLGEIGLTAAGVNFATEDSQLKRHALDKDLAQQMADLQKKSASATQLDPLKQLVAIRLQSISQQIQSHTLQEQADREHNQRELHSLMQKVREMEAESIELKSRLNVAQYRATRDPLTNLPNRQAYNDRIADEIARCNRNKTPLSMAVWDIDLFKHINDTYGHKSGDKALIVIAKLLSKYCRATDFVARFGGEEFVMLLPETDVLAALVLTEKLRELVEKSSFNAHGDKISITLSCGLSEFIAGDTHESLFERADAALYKAKQAGRNRCMIV